MKNGYSQAYYASIAPGSSASAEETVPVVLAFVQPLSVVDVGCGVGTWLKVWAQHGVEDYLGLDGDYVSPQQLRIPLEKFRQCNLEEPLALDRRFDLVTSLEVAEHIRPRYAPTFINSLCRLSDIVLFSAAIPGQGGVNHYNEQYPPYWEELFAANGFTGYDCLRPKLWNNRKIDTCYRQNVFFFVRDGARENYPQIVRHEGPLLSLVHPEHFDKKEQILQSYKAVLRTPFHAGWHFLKQWARVFRRSES